MVYTTRNLSLQPHFPRLEGPMAKVKHNGSAVRNAVQDSRFTELKEEFWSFSIAWNLQVLWVFLLELPETCRH